MPVKTRSRAKLENAERVAASQLINLSLTHPDEIGRQPVTPPYVYKMSPPPAPRRKRNLYINTTPEVVIGSLSPPMLRRQQNYIMSPSRQGNYRLSSRSIISELRQSTYRFMELLNELDEQYNKNVMMVNEESLL